MNTNNTKLIDRLDNKILEFNKKIATNYVNKTGRSKADLEEEIYCGSAIVFGLNTFVAKEYIQGFPLALTAVRSFSPKFRPKSNDFEDTTFGNTIGTIIKYTNVFLYCAGAANIALGTGGIIAGAAIRNPEMVKDSFKILGTGIGIFGWMSADYISKAEIEPVKADENKYK